jgi:SSS family solute:Na+ symporter
MFTRWATPAGGFVGLVAGTLAAGLHYLAYRSHWLPYGSDMSANFYGAICSWTVCFLVTIGVSLITKRKPSQELAGLVHTAKSREATMDSRGRLQIWIFAAVVLAVLVILNWVFY